jgi:hypothetical protein
VRRRAVVGRGHRPAPPPEPAFRPGNHHKTSELNRLGSSLPNGSRLSCGRTGRRQVNQRSIVAEPSHQTAPIRSGPRPRLQALVRQRQLGTSQAPQCVPTSASPRTSRGSGPETDFREARPRPRRTRLRPPARIRGLSVQETRRSSSKYCRLSMEARPVGNVPEQRIEGQENALGHAAIQTSGLLPYGPFVENPS